MAVINKNIKLPTTSTKVVGNGNTSVKLPTSSKNNTGGLYGQFTPTIGNTGGTNNTLTTPVGVGTLKPITVGGNGTGGTYGAVLTPELPTSITTPVYTPVIGGGSVGGVSVKPIDASQYFDGSVVGTVGGGFSGSNKGGVTDEGVIVGGTKNADDATFSNNGFTGTGATFVPSASGNSNSGKTQTSTTGTGAGANTSASTGASTGESNTPTTDTETETGTDETGTDETAPMTYEEYINEQKAREEERRQASLKEAEIYKERAAADAQASYMQNMSTYGVNAENMAQMGLTGGGYSDYLNAQAYAQKRSDMQTADKNKLAMEQQANTTYADGIAALNKDLFTYQETQRQNKTTGYNTLLGYAMDSESGLTEELIRAMGKNIGLSEEEIQSVINTMNTTQSNAKGEYSNNAFTALIADLQNPNAYGNYSEAGIRALGKQWGWTDEQIGQAVDIWSDTKKGTEVSLDGEDTSQYGAQAFISAIQNGAYTGTREELYETCLQNRNAGYMTDAEIDEVMKEYDRYISYKNGNVSADEYYNAANGDENAQNTVDYTIDASNIETNAKSKAVELGIDNKNIEKVVYVNRDKFNVEDFGDYLGTGSDGKQDNYLEKIVEDAKNGKIQVGQYIIANYGEVSTDCGFFLYVGNGCFVKVKDTGQSKYRESIYEQVYVPDGYKLNNVGRIKKK